MFEAAACARRASLQTVPEAEARHELDSGTAECVLDQPKLTWAVDLGDELRAMSTFDLWYGLSTGEIAAHARVWRVGREAWTEAHAVPELACALADVDADEPARETLDYVARPPSFGTADDQAPEPTEAARQSSTRPGEHDADSELAADPPAEELTPSSELPSAQVISVHPASLGQARVRRRRWPVAAALALAATLAVAASFQGAAPLRPNVAVGRAVAAAGRAETHAAEIVTQLPAGQANGAPLVASAPKPEAIAAFVKREVVRVKSWSPSDKGQKRKRQGSGARLR